MRSVMNWMGAAALAGIAISVVRRAQSATTTPVQHVDHEPPPPVSIDIDETVADAVTTEMRTVTRSQLSGLVGGATSIILAALLASWWLAVPGSVRGDTPPTDITTWIPMAWAGLGGRFSSTQILMFNGGMLTLCASMTVALAIGRATLRTTRDQVMSNLWRRQLGAAAYVAAVAAVVAAVLCWAGPLIRDSVGANVAAGVIAALAVLLVTAIRQESNDVSALVARRNCRARLQTITTRREAIVLPDPVGDGDPAAVPKSSVTDLLTRSLRGAAAIGVLVALGTVAAGKAAAVAAGEPLRVSPVVVLATVGGLSLLAVGAACALGVYTVRTWSANYLSWRARRRRWSSVAARSSVVVFFAVLALAAGQGRVAATTMLFVFYLATVTVTWLALQRGRESRGPRWLTATTEPVWRLVLHNLHSLEAATRRELEEAQAALSPRALPSPA